MPVYEYRCKACGKKTEDLVLAGDAAGYVPECAHCGSHDLSRLLSTFAAHGAPTSPCEGGVCPSMAGEGGGGCGGGKCPYS